MTFTGHGDGLPVELLHMILSELTPKDLVNAYQVCQHWKDVIDANSRLMRKAHIKPDFDIAISELVVFPRFPFGDGLKPSNRGITWDSRIPLQFRIYKQALSNGDTISPTWRKVFVTQPPITMITYMGCGIGYVDIKCKTGITFGHLYDAAHQRHIDDEQKGDGITRLYCINFFCLNQPQICT